MIPTATAACNGSGTRDGSGETVYRLGSAQLITPSPNSSIVSTTPRTHQQSQSVLRATNNHLESTVDELKLEIAYYKGEIQRLELEKDFLKGDVDRISNLFDNWVVEASGQAYKEVMGKSVSSSRVDTSGGNSSSSLVNTATPITSVSSPSLDTNKESSSNGESGQSSLTNSNENSNNNSNDNSNNNSNSNSAKQEGFSTQGSSSLEALLAIEDRLYNRRNAASTSASQGVSYIKEMVRYPCQSISDALNLRGDHRIWLVTSCQSPFYIEVKFDLYSS